MTYPNKDERQVELIAQMEDEGYRVLPLSTGGYVVVDLACPPCFAECSNFDALLKYCADNLDEHTGPMDAPF
jgi:hypothetical protein